MHTPLAIFDAVVDLAPAEREAQLDALCAGDHALRAEVARMLAADAAHGLHDVGAGPERAWVEALLASEVPGARGGAPAALPERVGPYRVLRVLGSGGMGVVYEAEEEHPQRRVALKVLHADLSLSDEILARFRGEVQTIADLRHPAIPRVFAAGEVHGRPWLAMERIDGAHLHHACDGRPLAARVALLRRVCQAVEAAHARGVFHCDLKPSNVLVDHEGAPHVLDFGLASTTRPAGDRAGTPAFMAPEQRRGEALDGRVDVYALGRIGVEVLPEADGDLAKVLARATAPEPEHRYPSVRELREDFERVIASRPLRGVVPVGHRAKLFVRRHQRLMGGGAVALALGLAVWASALALSTWRERERLEAREAAASIRLERLAGPLRDPTRDRVFEDFVALPENQGTRALAEAWIVRGDVLLAADRFDEGLLALAEGYTRAVDADQQSLALERLGVHFVAHERWAQLGALLDGGHASPALHDQLALGTRHLDALPEGLAHWARGSRLEARAYRVDVEPGGESFLTFDQSRSRVGRVRVTGGFPEVASWAMPEGVVHGFAFPRMVPGHDGLVIYRDAAWRPALWRLGDAPLRAGEGPPLTLLSAASEGGPVYLGTGGETGRRLFRLDPPAWVPVSPAPTLDTLGSDYRDLQLEDLDGDGVSELIVAQGPWRAYAITVLTRGPEGSLRVDASLQLGNAEGAQVLRTPNGPLLAVAVNPNVPNRIVLGDTAPSGGPRGIALLRWTPGALEQVGFVPSPGGGAEGLSLVEAVDVDGDGDEDLLARGSSSGRPFAWILLWDEGGLQALPRLSGMFPMASLQVDADAARELVVRLPDDDHRTWVLGAGERAVPPLVSELPSRHPAPAWAPEDPAITRIWERVNRLAELGLRAEVAPILLRAEPLATSPADALRLRTRAAELLLDGGRVGEALAALASIDPQATELGETRARLAARAAALDRRWGAPELQALGPSEREALALELGWSGLPDARRPIDLLDASLWKVVAPASLALGAGRARVEVFAHEGAVAATSFTPDPAGVELRLDLALSDVEFGGTARLILLDASGQPAMSLLVRHGGGGVDTHAEAGCELEGDSSSQRWPHQREHVRSWQGEAPGAPLRMRLAWSPTTQRLFCNISGASGDLVRVEQDAQGLDLSGAWTLAWVGAWPSPPSMARFQGVVHTLELRALDARAPATLPVLPLPPSAYGPEHTAMRRAPASWLNAHAPLDAAEVEAFARAWADVVDTHGPGDLAEGLLHPALEGLAPSAPGAFTLRLGRAVARYHRGELDEAAAELEAALAAPPSGAADSTRSRARALRVHIARVQGDARAEAAHMAAFQADTLTEAQRLERLERWVRVVAAE